MLIRKVMLLLCLVVLLISISSVCATDIDNSTYVTTDMGTFEELNHDLQSLKSGDVYNFEKDYCLNDNDFNFMNIKGPLIAADNVVVNGNGHVIDGADHSAALNVNGDNVTVSNLTFINSVDRNNRSVCFSDFNYRYSPVVWNGNGGLLLNCTFINNAGVVGGAVCWNGDDGLINLCIFTNNTASGVGGAIFIKGSNNVIFNSIFHNSTSQLSHEPIYFDPISINNTILNCFFEKNATYFINGHVTGISPECFFYKYETPVGRTYFDIVPLIYKSILNNGSAIYVGDDISYYSDFNGNDFLFTINMVYDTMEFYGELDTSTELKIDYVISKTLHFTGIGCLGDVFSILFNGPHITEYNLIANYRVKGPNCYAMAMEKFKSDSFDFFDDMIDEPCTMVKAVSIILYPTTQSVKSHDSWNLDNRGIDVFNINGNGLKIISGGDSSDEYHWADLNSDCIFAASNFIIEGFNSAVKNIGGYCILNNITFNKNKVDYKFEIDWGGAILNAGTVVCNNCTFKNNAASNGGAIFNQGIISINNATFKNNEAENKGDNVLNADNGIVLLDNIQINGSSGPIKYVKSISKKAATGYTVLSIVGSAFIGLFVGAMTGNPFLGAAAGAAAGLGLGTLTAYKIISRTYDINYNRLKTALICIGGSVVAGVLAGIAGGYFGQYAEATLQEIENAEDMPFEGVFRSRGDGEIVWRAYDYPQINIDNIIDEGIENYQNIPFAPI